MTSEEKTVTEIGENTNINIDSNVNDDDVNLDKYPAFVPFGRYFTSIHLSL
jgi:hypothetical protein